MWKLIRKSNNSCCVAASCDATIESACQRLTYLVQVWPAYHLAAPPLARSNEYCRSATEEAQLGMAYTGVRAPPLSQQMSAFPPNSNIIQGPPVHPVGDNRMDPLSLAASIAGLMGAAQQIYSLLELIRSSKNAPSSIAQAQIEVKHFRLALGYLQRYLSRLDQITEQRKQLIGIDELIITISDAVLSFSAFESLVSELARMTRVRAALSWFTYMKQVDEQVAKIQRHKVSLTFMCQILQW